MKNQRKNAKSNTAQKGIAIFVREEVKNIFHLVPMDNEDVIWVRLGKGDTGGARDVYIGTCYLNPSHAKNTDRKIARLAEDVVSLQERGDVMLLGDLNARTGNLEDTITPDESDELFELYLEHPPLKRNSQDSTVNSRGNELLDMCKSFDLNIINGRKTGDLFGNYTCFKWSGSSVVDYLVVSSSVSRGIPLFRVGEFLPWLSDHCPLYFTFELQRDLADVTLCPEPPRKKAPKQYVWTSEGKDKYLETLKSDNFQVKWEGYAEIDHSDPNIAVNCQCGGEVKD